MSKRKFDELDDTNVDIDTYNVKPIFKNSLDSDEEDDEAEEEDYDVMKESDLDKILNAKAGKGEERLKKYNIAHSEDEPSASETSHGYTAFNIKEELEEGHFDTQGHFHWKKEKEIRDNWLDNIDWLKVENKKKDSKSDKKDDSEDSDEDGEYMYDPIPLYKQILEYLQPGETISKALRRIGGKMKNLTTAQRWKRKKDPEAAKEDEEISQKITRLTELANELLTRTGNMDIYQESYEQIKKKIAVADKRSVNNMDTELDMYADDFDTKEKEKMGDGKNADASKSQEMNDSSNNEDPTDAEVKWELKWSQEADAKIHGPHTSEQMQKWSDEGFFKKGAWVRKVGTEGEFHNATRIDFELYM